MKTTQIFAAGLLSLFCGICTISTAQIRTAYFMDKAVSRTELNPALRPERGYINIPGLGGVTTEYSSNSLSLDNVLYPNPNGRGLVTFLHPNVSADRLLGELKDRNKLKTDVATNLIGFGFFSGKAFWTVGIDQKTNVGVSLPKGLFEFAKRGSGFDGKVYNFSDMQVDVLNYLQLAVGYSRPVNDRLTLGGKVKLLAGAASGRMTFRNMRINLSKDIWEVKADGEFEMSMGGLEYQTKQDELDGSNYYDMNSFKLKPNKPVGYGGAFDLGATYKLLDNLTLSAAVLDLGLISWRPEYAIKGRSHDEYSFTGFDMEQGGVSNTGDFDKLLHFEPVEAGNRISRLVTSLNFGAEYAIVRNTISFGVLSTTQFYSTSTFSELTLSANFRPSDWFSASVSYSFLHSRFDTFGIALDFSPSWIHFFVGTDYMFTKVTPQWAPVNQRTANVYLGVGIPLKRMREVKHGNRY